MRRARFLERDLHESMRALRGGGPFNVEPVRVHWQLKAILPVVLVLLAGLLLNSLLGWSWADPVAGLGIAAVAFREGFGAWRGERCC